MSTHLIAQGNSWYDAKLTRWPPSGQEQARYSVMSLLVSHQCINIMLVCKVVDRSAKLYFVASQNWWHNALAGICLQSHSLPCSHKVRQCELWHHNGVSCVS